MKSVILRSSSGSFLAGAMTASDSSRLSVSIPVQDTVASERRSGSSSPSISLHLGVNNGRSSIRRVSSESDMIRSEIEHFGGKKRQSKYGSKSFQYGIPEEDDSRTRSLAYTENHIGYGGDFPQSAIPVEELGFPGGGMGNNWNSGEGGGSDFGNHINMGMYYEQILKSDPSNPLFLRNYAKYLHEVEKDIVKAEECYGRAILANPGDGEVLSLYGKFIWESYGDENRAKSYLDRSVHTSPDDCMVLGSYAHFLWETDDEDDVVMKGNSVLTASTVEAF